MSAALASVVLQTQVFFTAFFGVLLLREHVSRPLAVGLFLAGLGLVCFGANYLAPGAAGGTSIAGFLLCVAAASMWAASNIVVRRAQHATPQFDVVGFMVWSSLIPILPFVGLSLVFDPAASARPWATMHLRTWIALAYLGWCATVAAYAMWTGLLKRHPANRVAPFSLGVPLIGITAGMLVLGDVITGWQWAGIGLIVAALVTVMFGPRLMQKKA